MNTEMVVYVLLGIATLAVAAELGRRYYQRRQENLAGMVEGEEKEDQLNGVPATLKITEVNHGGTQFKVRVEYRPTPTANPVAKNLCFSAKPGETVTQKVGRCQKFMIEFLNINGEAAQLKMVQYA